MTGFSTLVLFISLALMLAVVLAMIVLVPWLRPRQMVDNRLIDINIDVFQERLAELAVDKAEGVIGESQYQSQKVELERQLLDAQQQAEPMQIPTVKSRLIILIWVPVLAAMAYLLIGNRTPVYNLWQAQDTVGQVADDLLTSKIDTPPEWATEDSAALVSAMQTNVHHHAHDPNRWMRLSEVFLSFEATDSALEALSRAYRLAPENENIALTYAQISFFSRGGMLDATSRQILFDILTTNPEHEGAQMLMAMGETKAGNFEQAQGWVSRLRASIAAKPGDHTQALASLDELSANISEQQALAAQGVTVDVSVDSAMLPQIREGDVIFIAIRDVAGGAPYAAKRLPVTELSSGRVSVSLSSLDAMMPGRTLQLAREQGVQLAVSARISHSGNAITESGDLTGNPVVLSHDQTQAAVEINQLVP